MPHDVKKRRKGKQKRSAGHGSGNSPSRRAQSLERVVMMCEDVPSENGSLEEESGAAERSSTYLGSVYSIRSELLLKEMYEAAPSR